MYEEHLTLKLPLKKPSSVATGGVTFFENRNTDVKFMRPLERVKIPDDEFG